MSMSFIFCPIPWYGLESIETVQLRYYAYFLRL